VRDALEQKVDAAAEDAISGSEPQANESPEVPVDVDAILKDLGLDGPIGSRAAERAVDPMRTPEAMKIKLAEWATEMIRLADAVASPSFPEAYLVPGARLIPGEYPGAKFLMGARTKLRALLDAGVTHVIDLTCAGELRPYVELLAKEAATRGVAVKYQRRPIRDVDVCTPEQMRTILDEIDASLARARLCTCTAGAAWDARGW